MIIGLDFLNTTKRNTNGETVDVELSLVNRTPQKKSHSAAGHVITGDRTLLTLDSC